jgi:hypothetical protein
VCVAVKLATNSTIGIYAKAYVSVVINAKLNNMFGMAVSVPAVAKCVIASINGMALHVLFAAKSVVFTK